MLFTSPNTTITITMDASMEGWGGHCIVPGSGPAIYSDLWTKDECQLHINVLELRAIRLHLEQDVLSQMILIESDNTATVLYINTQGEVVSKTINDKASSLFELLIPRSIWVKVMHQQM